MANDPYKYFRVEARELLDQLGSGALELEREGGGSDLVGRLLRLAHTLKGAARVVKQPLIADQAHAIEEALAPFRNADLSVPRERIDVLLGLLDNISGRLAGLSPSEPAPGAAPAKSAPDENVRTIRADVEEMDSLLEGVTETHSQLMAIRKYAKQVERLRFLATFLTEQLRPRVGAEGARSESARSEKPYAVAEEIRSLCDRLERGMGEGVDQMERELREIRDVAEHMRLVPVGTLFTTLERASRDTAQTLGKQVAFEGVGGDVRIDTHVLGAVQGALLQMIRNSVAHGIEAEATRVALGKSPVGRVIVEVVRRDRRVIFRCSDDGRGVDLAAVKAAAVRKGIPREELEQSGAADLTQMLLRAGISTSAVVTEVSGRGIGLDVVREVAERLGGEVAVQTEPNRGTTLELNVPLTLTSVGALMVESGGAVFSVPLDAVRQTIHLGDRDLAHTPHRDAVVYNGTAIPFLSLARLLRQNGSARDARASVAVVIKGQAGIAALGVDRLHGTANVVVRPLPEFAPANPVVAGVSLDAEGNPQLMLDPDALATMAMGMDAAERATVAAPAPILVIDDSLTTRMLEQSILESAGYDVDVATSGEAALEAARKRTYGLFLVDVEMPGIDGFTFVERIRADLELRDIPAILITSRCAPEDKQRGHDAGAQGYIVKSDFDQSELLASIKRLMR